MVFEDTRVCSEILLLLLALSCQLQGLHYKVGVTLLGEWTGKGQEEHRASLLWGGEGGSACGWMLGELRHWPILLWIVFSSKSLYREPRYFSWKVKSIQKCPMESREHWVYKGLISESHHQCLVKPNQCYCQCLKHKFTHNSGELKAILQPSNWCFLYW